MSEASLDSWNALYQSAHPDLRVWMGETIEYYDEIDSGFD
jgi:hypothetical protein